jgi:hypothetical protein
MHVTRWALIGAALLAAFQAWLWAGQDSPFALVGAIALAVALVVVALRPGTRVAAMLGRVWALPRASGESERHYRFKIAAAWLLVVALCVLGCIAVRSTTISGPAGIALRVFGFVAVLMALQSLLVGLFRSAASAPPNTPLQATRETRAPER